MARKYIVVDRGMVDGSQVEPGVTCTEPLESVCAVLARIFRLKESGSGAKSRQFCSKSGYTHPLTCELYRFDTGLEGAT